MRRIFLGSDQLESQGFEALFNNGAIGIITVDHKGEIILANKFILKLFGYEEGELKGQKIEKLIPARYHHNHVKNRDSFHQHHYKSRPMGLGMDLFGCRKDGAEFPVEASLSAYLVNEEQYTIAFVSDITVRKRSEEALLQLNAQLEMIVNERTRSLAVTVEKLEEQIREAEEKDQQLRKSLEKEKELNELKSRFVSLASHEFRTPLSTILSSAYLVTKYTSEQEQPKREKHIDRIVSSVNMLNDTLNDFLSVGKIEEGKIQVRTTEFDLQQLVQSVVNEMKTITRKGQVVSYRHLGPRVVNLDQSLIKHIIMNLISNAIKFSPENGTIEVHSAVEENIVTLRIKDYGMGISKEDMEHLFERFFRGANVTNIQGTGLGLHIVMKYAELMNGVVTCKSDLDQGTEFTITFNKILNA